MLLFPEEFGIVHVFPRIILIQYLPAIRFIPESECCSSSLLLRWFDAWFHGIYQLAYVVAHARFTRFT